MSSADESHQEPKEKHEAKAGAHGNSAAQDPGHGHDDSHEHPVAADFIPEGSPQDALLQFVVVPLTALGLILMMYLIATSPIKAEEPGSFGGPSEHVSAPSN
jgi:hypothetical protein